MSSCAKMSGSDPLSSYPEVCIHQIIALIPCYNVEKYCQKVIELTLQHAAYLILVDDGSTDRTGQILKKMVLQHKNKIHLITFPHNQGKGAALLKGIDCALTLPFEVLVTLDSDGQHVPSEIKKLADCILDGAQLAIGCRDFTQMPFRSRFGNSIISFFLRRMYPKAPIDNQSGFRSFSHSFAKKIAKEVSGARYEMEFRCILLALRDGDLFKHRVIKTIYLDQNRSSHFFKVRDSYRILCVLFRYWVAKKLAHSTVKCDK
jgi:glycosyltransferase involved in cell wall biosynthesis